MPDRIEAFLGVETAQEHIGLIMIVVTYEIIY